MIIRDVELKDSGKIIDLLKVLDTETEFMLYEPDERNYDLENQKQIIEGFITSPSKTMLVSENSRDITGFIVGIGGSTQRTKHNLYIVIGIKQNFTGQNLGATFFEILEKWAKKHNFSRLELTVMTHNQRAIKLYKSIGFLQEGVKHNSIKLKNGFVDEICMYKLI